MSNLQEQTKTTSTIDEVVEAPKSSQQEPNVTAFNIRNKISALFTKQTTPVCTSYKSKFLIVRLQHDP